MKIASLSSVARCVRWEAAAVVATCCLALSAYGPGSAARGADPSTTTATEDHPAVPGEYVVRVAKNANLRKVQTAVEKATGFPTTALHHVRLLTLKTTPESGAQAAAAAAKVEGVAGVDPNYVVKPVREETKKSQRSIHATRGLERFPDDTQYDDQSWYFDRIQAEEAWEIEYIAPEVIIAVIDDGILYEHVDLKDRMWDNDDEQSRNAGNGIDDDDNGYIDDTNGWDFVQNDNDPSPFNDSDRSLAAGERGTFVAGVAGARANNGEGIAGIAWSVQLMNLRVFGPGGAGGFGTMANVAKAIDYAIEEEADVILIPWNVLFDNPTLRSAMDATEEAKVLVVCAAGDGLEFFPAAYNLSNQLTVLATNQASGTQEDVLASSNTSSEAVHIGAPGSEIWGCDIDEDDTAKNNAYRSESGTHAAAALVAGTAALMYAINPDLTPQRVRLIVEQNGDILENLIDDPDDPDDNECSSGARLNLLKTLEAVPPPLDPPPPPTDPDREAGRDFRELGAQATTLLGYGFYYNYLDLYYGPKSTLSNDAYNQAQQAYYYALLAGTVIYWDKDLSPGKSFAAYSQVKYGQLVYTYYATSYAYYSYSATGDEITGAAALYLYYSTLYSYYDIQYPPELKPKRARGNPKNRRGR